jgi:hypothetical protein
VSCCGCDGWPRCCGVVVFKWCYRCVVAVSNRDVAAETNADSEDVCRHRQTTQHIRRGPLTCCTIIVAWPHHVVHALVGRCVVSRWHCHIVRGVLVMGDECGWKRPDVNRDDEVAVAMRGRWR